MFNRYSFRISKGFDLIILNSAVSHSPTLTLHFCISRQSQPGGFVEFLRCNSLEASDVHVPLQRATTVHDSPCQHIMTSKVGDSMPCLPGKKTHKKGKDLNNSHKLQQNWNISNYIEVMQTQSNWNRMKCSSSFVSCIFGESIYSFKPCSTW